MITVINNTRPEMPGDWIRPKNVPFPSVWSRFEGKREIDGKIPKFWIQDVPEKLFETAIDIMCKNFIYDEPLNKYSKLSEDELSVQELRETWKEVIKYKLAIICFMENPDPKGNAIIAGLNITYPAVKGASYPNFKGKKASKILGAVLYLCDMKDAYEILGIDVYMNAFGLSVLPEFRGQGIGDELLKARFPLCKAVGLKATLTVFTATVSQKLAARVGFKDLATVSYADLEKRDSRFKFPGIEEHTTECKFMYKLIN